MDAKAGKKSTGLSLPLDLGLCLFQEALTAAWLVVCAIVGVCRINKARTFRSGKFK
jgi:hypothetical protein